jgi:hypothetical protein
MKKIVLAMMLVGATLMAAPYTQADRIKDMNDMANAMNIIQSGFFYNNYNTVEVGVEKLVEAVQRVKPPIEEIQEKDLVEKYMNQKIQMSNKIVKKINKKSLDILARFKSGDSVQAVQAYTKIMGQCIKCHRETRNW